MTGEYVLHTQSSDNVVLADVAGEVDMANCNDLRHDLYTAVDAAARALVLDVSRLDYVDSSGIGVIFDVSKMLAKRRQRLFVVVGVAGQPKRTLALSGLPQVADVFDERESAMNAARGLK
jgi:anti-sigma B factor antagonist